MTNLEENSLLFRIKPSNLTDVNNERKALRPPVNQKTFELDVERDYGVSRTAWKRARGYKDTQPLGFQQFSDLCYAINDVFDWSHTYGHYSNIKLPRHIAEMRPSRDGLDVWRTLIRRIVDLPDGDWRRNVEDLEKAGDNIHNTKAKTTHRRLGKPPAGVTIWKPGDASPSVTIRGKTASNERPRQKYLLDGRYAPRTEIYGELFGDLEHWFSCIGEDEVADETLPIYWIAGPSGAGKSVALLFALANLASDDRRVVVSLRNIRKIPDVLRWWHENQLDEVRLVIGIDDAYSPNFPNRKEIWDEYVEEAQDALEEYGPASVPIIVACGPTEQCDQVQQADTSQQLNIRKHAIPSGTKKEAQDLGRWYAARTNGELPTVPDYDAPIVQLFWEWQHGSLKLFAINLSSRLADFDDQDRGDMFDYVAKVLAFNRLYVSFPSVLLDRMNPRQKDFYAQLCSELHYDGGAGDDDNRSWLMHPHLAGVVYNEWVTAWRIGSEEQTAHLVAPIENAHKLSTVKAATAKSLQALVHAISTASPGNPNLIDFPWTTVWSAFCDLHTNWTDTDNPNELRESLTTWLMIRMSPPPKAIQSTWKPRYFKPDPVKCAIELTTKLRRDSPLLEEILETLAYHSLAIGKQFKGKIVRAVYDCLERNHRFQNWPRIAHAMIRNTGHSRTLKLSVAWLHYHPTETRGWGDLWKLVAKTYFELGQNHPDSSWVLEQLVTLGDDHHDHNAWPHVWRHAWDYADPNSGKQLEKMGLRWLKNGAAPDSKWHHIWFAIKDDKPIANDMADTIIRRFECSSSWHSSWERVWEHSMLNIDDPDKRKSLLEVARTRHVTHPRWPNTIRNVANQTNDDELRSELTEYAYRWIQTQSVRVSGWGSAFGLVWDNHDPKIRDFLWSQALQYLQLRKLSSDSFSSWSHVWKRCFAYLEESQNAGQDVLAWQRSLLRTALAALGRCSDPVGAGSAIRNFFRQILSSDVQTRHLFRSEAIQWLHGNTESPNWKYVWLPLADAARESERGEVEGLTMGWLDDLPLNDDWMDVFRNALESASEDRLEEFITATLGRALDAIEISGLATDNSLSFTTFLTKLLKDRTEIRKSESETPYLVRLQQITAQDCETAPKSAKDWPFRWLNAVRSCQSASVLDRLTHLGIEWLTTTASHGHKDRVLKKLLEIAGKSDAATRIEDFAIAHIQEGHDPDPEYFLHSIWVRHRKGNASKRLEIAVGHSLAHLSDSDCQQLVSKLKMLQTEETTLGLDEWVLTLLELASTTHQH